MLKLGIVFDDEPEDGNDVLLLYSRDALPEKHKRHMKKTSRSLEMDSEGLPKMTPKAATANCNYLNVALIQEPEPRQCLAIVSHHDDASFHIQSFRREKGKSLPLVPVGKGINGEADGGNTHPIPGKTSMQFHYRMLHVFLENFERVLPAVKQLGDRIARNNTIAAITTNKGYSDLLANFACLSKARGIDIGHVLVFATDPETQELAESLGMAAFYDEKMFGSFPSKGAEFLGDTSSFKMMYAQVMCIRILSMLGYNFLFQDVDVFWFRDPIKYFEVQKDYDIYFMDDGAHWRLYAPYSANKGFFFARNNKRTKNLFSAFFGLANHVFGMNDQALLNNLLSVHAGTFGLRVEVLSKEEIQFMGGYHFHHRHDMMRPVMEGKQEPYAFHMHWSDSEDKRKYLRQMGLWHVKEEDTARHRNEKEKDPNHDKHVYTCSAEPLFRCFYRDLPSKYPC